jgi:hypothetical protein
MTASKKCPIAVRTLQIEEAARFEVMRLLPSAPAGCSALVLSMKNADTSWIDVLTFVLDKMA